MAALTEHCFSDPRAAASLKVALAALSREAFSDVQKALILQVCRLPGLGWVRTTFRQP